MEVANPSEGQKLDLAEATTHYFKIAKLLRFSLGLNDLTPCQEEKLKISLEAVLTTQKQDEYLSLKELVGISSQL